MKRPRFAIASLLAVIVLVAVSLAALREATALWDGAVFGVTLLTLLTSVLLAAHRSEQRRAFWLGFAVFGWAYLVASLVPTVESRLPTTRALVDLNARMPRAAGLGSLWVDFDHDGTLDMFVTDVSGAVSLTGNVTSRGLPPGPSGWSVAASGGKAAPSWTLMMGSGGTSENFRRIGHSLLALSLACFGGGLSRWLYSGGQRPA